MKFRNSRNILIVAGLVVAVAIIVSVKKGNVSQEVKTETRTDMITPIDAAKSPAEKPALQEKPTALPRLVDLGADKCIPCRMMAPILEELGKEFQGRFTVEFIDVWKNPDAGGKYGINIIPTQIFYDASGKELFRHEGFLPKADILRKWKDFGIEIKNEEMKAAEGKG